MSEFRVGMDCLQVGWNYLVETDGLVHEWAIIVTVPLVVLY